MGINKFVKLILTLTAIASPAVGYDVSTPVWGYECLAGKCVKLPFTNVYSSQSLSVCRMLCGGEIGTLWPKPTGSVKIGEYVVEIDHSKIKFRITSNSISERIWTMVKSRFQEQVDAKIPESGLISHEGRPLLIRIQLEGLTNEVSIPKLTYDTDESYSLGITHDREQVLVDIYAKTFFGARHGLETLTQLIVYDDVGKSVQILTDTDIDDAPAYKHRGVLLDTGRHYFSVKAIKRTLDGMAMSKLNTFHWHIVDSNSFPLEVKSHPDLQRFGAYSPRKIYTHEDIVDVVEYARVRGIRVIPEFDGPAHTGEGWQRKNVTVCFNAQPWKKFCNQPPCGQLDPTIDRVYSILEDIYREIFESFDPNIFHMGGDTVSISCWNSSLSIQDWMIAKGWNLRTNDFLKLWGHFQTNALAKVDEVSNDEYVPVILWASQLTTGPFIDKFLDKSRYIIQTVSNDADRNTRQILDRGFRMISTSFDLFVNGGTANWNGGNIGGWQKFYENRPDGVLGGRKELILGSEAAVWAEQIDEFTIDGLLWPKASALGERLWSNPRESYRKAESRLLVHRELLAENGLAPEAVQPEWCLQNQNECPRDAYD